MKNTKFNLFELFAIICLLISLIVTVTVTIPKFSKTREQSFRVEATRVVENTELAIERYKDKRLQIKNNEKSCVKDNKFCFTVQELIDLELYDQNSDTFRGKVIIDYNEDGTVYDVFFKKNDEFKIIHGFRKSYIDFGVLSNENWQDDYEKCNCEIE